MVMQAIKLGAVLTSLCMLGVYSMMIFFKYWQTHCKEQIKHKKMHVYADEEQEKMSL
jgi:hypothetical protein